MGQAAAVPATSSRPSHRWLVLAVAIAVPLAGCGGFGFGSGDGGAGAILADWRSFPADANPRPPVLTGPTILDPQVLPGDYKEAYLTGRVDLAAALPASPPTAGGYPVIAARTALDQLRQAYPVETIKGARTTPRLRIVAVKLGLAYFETDRGSRRLPAWRFGFDRLDAPTWVLAVDPKALWTAKPTSAPNMDFSATPSPDGRSLTVDFIGGPDEPTPCGISYTASAAESATAVVIVLHDKPQRGKGQVACTGMGYSRTVAVQLAAALGGRVLLTPYGVPMQVPGT